jgi:DNA-binding XRE family transcriptional regulator
MIKKTGLMSKVHTPLPLGDTQIIRDSAGVPVYAVVPWSDFERLQSGADETATLIAAGEAARGDYTFPADVAARLVAGESALKVIREWRDMTQAQLGTTADVAPVYISQIERGTRNMGRNAAKKLAPALGLPVDVLMDL